MMWWSASHCFWHGCRTALVFRQPELLDACRALELLKHRYDPPLFLVLKEMLLWALHWLLNQFGASLWMPAGP